MAEKRQIIIAGAGGHATVVVDALILSGCPPVFILDDDPSKAGGTLAGTPIRGPIGSISAQESQRSLFVVAIAKNDLRKQLVNALSATGASLTGVRHPSCIISPRAEIDATAQIMAGVIVNAGAKIKAHAVLNTGCIIEHDTIVSQFAHVGPGAVLAGAVVLEEGAFAATGAKVCPFVRLGAWSTLGAGAVALRDVPGQSVAAGVPAHVLSQRKGA